MSSINILHASDLHLSPDAYLRSSVDRWSDLDDVWDYSPSGIIEKARAAGESIKALIKKHASSQHPEALESLARFIYINSKSTPPSQESQDHARLDAVVLTGDLATTGREDDIKQVKYFLSAHPHPRHPYTSDDPKYKDATLAGVGIPVIFLPGNHDRFQPKNSLHDQVPVVFAPGGTLFDGLGVDYRKEPVQKKEISTPIENGELRVMILTADFTLRQLGDHSGRFGWLAQGRANGQNYRRILDELIEKTRQVRLKTRENDVLCVLWAIHFPPFFPGIQPTNMLLGQNEFAKAATDEKVDGILAGHTHEQLTYRNPALKCRVFCCGTTTQFEPQALPGGRDQEEVTKGNSFQVINVSLSDHGNAVRVTAQDYRLYGIKDQYTEQTLWEWRKVP